MIAYYNEIEPYAAQWLRNLIAAGHIAPGDVDERSIEDVKAEELKGYTQCHFFAGIGVWSHALRLAGWPDDRPVWTGSCPCQPFSAAGRGNGSADSRHLWPTWFRLIREQQPVTVFGEQVASADGLAWLDLVHSDLEAAGYTVGALDICAAGFGAPHIRNRLYWVANADTDRDGLQAHSYEVGVCDEANLKRNSGHARAVGGENVWDTARPTGCYPVALGNGSSGVLGRLRAYGNAIVAPQAAEFIAAFMEYAP